MPSGSGITIGPPDDTPAGDTPEGRRLLAALETLARAVEKNNTALSTVQNAARFGRPWADGAATPAAQTESGAAYNRRTAAGERLGSYDPDRDYRPVTAAPAKPPQGKPVPGADWQDALRQILGAAGVRPGYDPLVKAVGGKSLPSDRDPMGMLLAGVTRVLGPMAIFERALSLASMAMNHQNSGLEQVQRGLQLVAGVLAPVFLPAAVMLTAALVALSDELWDEALPAFEKLFPLMLEYGVPALRMWVDQVMAAVHVTELMARNFAQTANVFIRFANMVNDKSGGLLLPGGLKEVPVPEVGGLRGSADFDRERALREADDLRKRYMLDLDHPTVAGLPKERGGFAGMTDEERVRAEQERGAAFLRMQALERFARGEGPAPDGFGGGRRPGGNPFQKGDFVAVLQEVIQSLKMQHGQRAGFTDFAEFHRQAIVNTLNLDPIERRQQEQWNRVINLLEQAVARLGPAPAPQMQPGGGPAPMPGVGVGGLGGLGFGGIPGGR